jgi:uncharacterized protein
VIVDRYRVENEVTIHDPVSTLVTDGKVAGPLVHEARIAALCLAHGVAEFWTLDRDFSRFPALKTRIPLS